MDIILVVVAVVIAALGLGCLYWRRSMDAETALMAAIETSRAADIAGIAPGTLVEVKGTIRCDAPLTAEFTQSSCVHVRSLIERREVRRDDKQQQQTHYIPESDVTNSIPFEVEDESGCVRVDPTGAKIEARSVLTEMRSTVADDVITLTGTLTGGGSNAHRYSEWMLPLDNFVYVLGTVQPDGSIGAAPPNAERRNFLVTYETEEERAASSHKWSQALLWIALALFVGALVVFYKSFK